MSTIRRLGMLSRYLRGLPRYLGHRFDPADAPGWIAAAHRERGREFLALLDHGVFSAPGSPYRDLFAWAGVERGDVLALVDSSGVESALRRLRESGVYVTLDEFQGRTAIERGSRRRQVSPSDFDNPGIRGHFEGWTGGSGGAARRSVYDLDFMFEDAVARALFSTAFDLGERVMGLWRPAPPDNSALANLLFDAKLGRTFERWFVQRRHGWSPSGLQHGTFTAATRLAARRAGVPIPAPRHTPISEAGRVAAWLARRRADGERPYLDSLVSCAVRVCLAAEQRGLDIEGTFFRVGSEPFTPARAEVIRRVGGQAACYYAMMELGLIGVGCATPSAVDDVHVLSHKLAILTVDEGQSAPALHLTTLRRTTPKIMINVESGDVGDLDQRGCGCVIGQAGLTTHLTGVRSDRRITSEGMTFMSSDLQELVDEVLPSRFGGRPTHYQFAEVEVGGLARVELVVSPAVGDVDPEQLNDVVLRHLSRVGGGGSLMAEVWRQGDTLRVERREPAATDVGKVLALHRSEIRTRS